MTNESDRAGLDRQGAEYTRALVEGDLEGWLATLTDDCIFFPPGTPAVKGKEAVGRWAKESILDVFNVGFEFGYEDHDITGSSASAWGWYKQELSPKDGGETLHFTGKFIDVFRREESGGWKLHWCCFNTDHE